MISIGPTVLFQGDCRDVLRQIPSDSVDAVVCDPPYGLSAQPDMTEVLRHWLAGDDYHATGGGFMGKTWDSFVPGPVVWREVFRILKPGGHLAAFFGTRTYDLGTLAIRLAGFEIRDQLAWVYGSGFPKSLDVSKAIDAALGAEREVIGVTGRSGSVRNSMAGDFATAAASPQAARWQGFGTALKPAWEPIALARKPLIGTVAQNVLAHGVGGLNIDGCRVGEREKPRTTSPRHGGHAHNTYGAPSDGGKLLPPGRFPANIMHDGSPEVVENFPRDASAASPVRGHEPSAVSGNVRRRVPGQFYNDKPRGKRPGGWGNVGADSGDSNPNGPTYGDSGSAARFFYCAKASKSDRNEGLDGAPKRAGGMNSNTSGQHIPRRDPDGKPEPGANHHPTVKPTALMQWLCRLVTPPGGLIVDPFMGSGSTGKAAVREGFAFIGIEQSAEYLTIAAYRIMAETLK